MHMTPQQLEWLIALEDMAPARVYYGTEGGERSVDTRSGGSPP